MRGLLRVSGVLWESIGCEVVLRWKQESSKAKMIANEEAARVASAQAMLMCRRRQLELLGQLMIDVRIFQGLQGALSELIAQWRRWKHEEAVLTRVEVLTALAHGRAARVNAAAARMTIARSDVLLQLSRLLENSQLRRSVHLIAARSRKDKARRAAAGAKLAQHLLEHRGGAADVWKHLNSTTAVELDRSEPKKRVVSAQRARSTRSSNMVRDGQNWQGLICVSIQTRGLQLDSRHKKRSVSEVIHRAV